MSFRATGPFRALATLLCAVFGLNIILAGCPSQSPPENSNITQNDNSANTNDNSTNQNDNSSHAVPKPITWTPAFEPVGVGALSSVWGSSPTDVFIVGGTPEQGQIFHFDGTDWERMPVPPGIGLLVWVFGFAPDEVFAVGVRGAAVQFDGIFWTPLDSGTTEDLWGIWGRSAGDMWFVGGSVGDGQPVLLHFNGTAFTPVAPPANDRNATSLFKVWGIGSKTFAVGERGLIIQFDGANWFQVAAGAQADEDFVSLWGTSENNIVAVGGRSGGRIATYDGSAWSTQRLEGTPGLNGVNMTGPTEAIIGGVDGFWGRYDPAAKSLTKEQKQTDDVIHAIWFDGRDRCYAVGGVFSAPYSGVAYVRTAGDPGFTPKPPRNISLFADCNLNGLPDVRDIAGGVSRDCNGNNVPDECEKDGDADGLIDACDECPQDALKTAPGDCGCGTPDVDADGDGTPDCHDACPNDATKTAPGACGCGTPDADSDGDGVPDCRDRCPGAADGVDGDGDGVADCLDGCPNDPNKTDPGNAGCGVSETDSDGDGVPDVNDQCPAADDNLDTDGDGTPDCKDGCPNDLDKTQPGICGCGQSDGDRDHDGIPDCQDAFPDDPLNGKCPNDDACPAGQICIAGDCVSGTRCTALCDCDADETCGAGGVCSPLSGPHIKVLCRGPGLALLPVCDGGTLTGYPGFQGLVDVYFYLRAAGFAPGAEVSATFRIRRTSTGDVLAYRLYDDFLNADGSTIGTLNNVHVIVVFTPCEVCDQDVTIEVTLTDEQDPSLTASATLTAKLAIDGFNCGGCP